MTADNQGRVRPGNRWVRHATASLSAICTSAARPTATPWPSSGYYPRGLAHRRRRRGRELPPDRRGFAQPRRRFARVIWVPGNHELWSLPGEDGGLRGRDRYAALVELARSHDVLTPEDPWPTLGRARRTRDDRAAASRFTTTASRRPGSVRRRPSPGLPRPISSPVDEVLLHAGPICLTRPTGAGHRVGAIGSSASTSCHRACPRCWSTTGRCARTWCASRGSRASRPGAARAWTEALAPAFHGGHRLRHGHLHVRGRQWRHGIRFEEVSLGYPRQWEPARGIAALHQADPAVRAGTARSLMSDVASATQISQRRQMAAWPEPGRTRCRVIGAQPGASAESGGCGIGYLGHRDATVMFRARRSGERQRQAAAMRLGDRLLAGPQSDQCPATARPVSPVSLLGLAWCQEALEQRRRQLQPVDRLDVDAEPNAVGERADGEAAAVGDRLKVDCRDGLEQERLAGRSPCPRRSSDGLTPGAMPAPIEPARRPPHATGAAPSTTKAIVSLPLDGVQQQRQRSCRSIRPIGRV